MASSSSSLIFFIVAYLFAVVSIGSSNAQLTITFYNSSCPNLFSTVKSVVQSAINSEARMGASLLRLFFHDCFVNLGGPTWNVKLGRRDATTASKSAANTNIPPPTSNLSALISSFQNQGLSTTDMVALSGAHTIGQARCITFRNHIYNESNIDASFAKTRQANCPSTSNSGDNNLATLDVQTPTALDNNYYKNLVNQNGLLHSDQQLFSGGSTNSLVQTYSNTPTQFNSDFVTAMINMEDIKPLTGSNGEIRKNCRKTN